MAPFIDSHAHIVDPAFDPDRRESLQRALHSGCEGIISIGTSPADSRASLDLARASDGFVHSTAGLHPHEAAAFDPARDVALIRELLVEGAVGVGECGLDYHYDNAPRDIQRRAFSAQLELAGELGRAVVVHNRDADEDMEAIVREAGSAGVRGVLHCFTGPERLANVAIEAGWYLSFSGIVTFKKWASNDLIRLAPEDRILVESDSPYLAPVPHRGKRNEPAFVSLTLARVAEARGISASDMGTAAVENARRLFGLRGTGNRKPE